MSSHFNSFGHLDAPHAATALAAIEARLDGVFDHPALKHVGPLGDTLADVRRILNLARHNQLPAPPLLVHVYPDGAPEERIMGYFNKQTEHNRRIEDGEECEFDATAHVLGMDLEDIQALEDYSTDVDDIALKYVSWNGPFRAMLVDSIAEFFDVDVVDDITQDMLDEKRRLYGIEPAAEAMKP